MILRIVRSLRAHVFPAIALLGVALLLAGGYEYARFYRDLYVEEVETLSALERVGGSVNDVRYLRAGTPAEQWSNLGEESPPGLLAMPFVGRVERIHVNLDLNYDPVAWEAVRERALRLPGLTSFREDCPGGNAPPPSRSFDLRHTLGRPLPEFDPPIEEAELDASFPRGEVLEADAAQKIFDATLASWTASEGPTGEGSEGFDRPYLAMLDLPHALIAEVRDGDRVWNFASERDPFAEQPAPPEREYVTLSEHGVTQTLETVGDEWRLTGRGPDLERFGQSDVGTSQTRLGFHASAFVSWQAHLRSALKMLSVARVDGSRYAIAFAPCDVEGYEKVRFRRLQVIVRSDFDYAIERMRIELRPENQAASEHAWRTFDEVRRLRRGGGVVFWTERLARDRFRCAPDDVLELTRERFAVEFDPQNYETAFDLGTYGVRPWRDPEPLPELRTYRLLLPAGLVAIVFGVVGHVAQRLRTKRRTQGSLPEASRRVRGIRLPALRFGFLTLGSAALLTISLSGWVKSKLDEMERESSLFDRAESVSGIARHEPGFPWSAIASDTFPIDSPLKSVDVWTSDVEIRDGFLKLPRLERFQASAVASRLYPETLQGLSLGTPLPDPQLTIDDEDFDRQIPPGETLSGDEARDVAKRMFAAWAEANGEEPNRFCVVSAERFPSWEEGDRPRVRVELRDGERFWKALARNSNAADYNYPQSSVWCSDGAWDYLYARREPTAELPDDRGAWTLASRRYADDDQFVMFDVDAEALERSVLPRAFAWVGCDPVGDRMAVWLETHSSSLEILDVERLPDGRYRIELEPPRVPPAIASSPFPWEMYPRPGGVARWTIVVDERSGWSVERSDLELLAESYRESVPFDRATSSTLSRYARIGERTTLVECRTRIASGPPESDGRSSVYSTAWAYDFAPTIDERVFRAPSLDDPHPPPDPEAPAIFQWWMATGLIAIGGFLLAGFGRLRERRKRTNEAPSAEVAS